MDATQINLWARPDATTSGVDAPRTLPDFEVYSPITIRAHAKDGKASALDDSGKLWVRALVSTPNIDEQNEIVETEAFRAGMSKFAERPVMLAFHDMAQPVGLWEKQEITDLGVTMEGFISSGAPKIQQLVIDGVLSSASIGFSVKDGGLQWDDELDVLKIIALELYEVSLVPLPANLDTFVNVMDAAKSWTLRKSLEIGRPSRPKPQESLEPSQAKRVEPVRVSTVALPDVGQLVRVVGRVGSVLAGGVGSIADGLDEEGRATTAGR